MERKPRPTKDSVFSDGAGVDMIWQGLLMAILVICSFFVGQHMELGYFGFFESADGMSMAFLTMNFVEIFHAICMRSQKNSIFTLKTMNWWLLGAFILSTALTISVIYIPFFAELFKFTSISFKELAVALGLAASIIPIIEIGKFFRRQSNKK